MAYLWSKFIFINQNPIIFMIKLKYLTLLSFLFQLTLNAQEPCLYHQAIHSMEAEYPGYIEAIQRTFKEAQQSNNQSFRSVAKIPVVVHIVWKEDAENLPDTVIKQQIQILNKAFRRKNSDTSRLRPIFKPFVADALIEFELKEIRRVKTTKNFQANLLSLAGLDAVKQTAKGGDDPLDPTHFLNIWVCNILPINILGSSSPLLGYAYPPANLSHWPAGSSAPSKGLDGVVIWHKAFGTGKTLNVSGLGDIPILGKTIIHEVGHYLGLRHIWGDGQAALLGGKDCKADDGIADTPKPGSQSQFTCDTTKNSCVDTPIDYPDMVENYMDYSSETCSNSFTKGQIAMMQAVLAGPRKGLLESPSSIQDSKKVAKIELSPNPANEYIYLKINNLEEIPHSSLQIIDALGRVILNQNINSAELSIDIKTLEQGQYYLKVGNSVNKVIKL